MASYFKAVAFACIFVPIPIESWDSCMSKVTFTQQNHKYTFMVACISVGRACSSMSILHSRQAKYDRFMIPSQYPWYLLQDEKVEATDSTAQHASFFYTARVFSFLGTFILPEMSALYSSDQGWRHVFRQQQKK